MPIDNAAFVSISGVPTQINAGSAFTALVTVRNTGDGIWGANSTYRLGTQAPPDNLIWGFGRAFLSAAVAPNQIVTFNISCTAPATNGTYQFQTRMVLEGSHWFGDFCPASPISVTVVNGGTTLPPDPPPTNPIETPTPGVIFNLLPIDPNDGSIVGNMIINAVAYPITPTSLPAPELHAVDWSYAGSINFGILFSRIWHGLDNGFVADINGWAEVLRNNNLINMFPFDRYALPNGLNTTDTFFPEPGIILKPGDKIRFHYYARSAGGGVCNVAHTLYIWGKYL